MSTTIAIALEEDFSEQLFSKLRETAKVYGYAVIPGLKSAETDVLKGIKQATEALNWKAHIFIKAPADGKGTLAFGIQEELRDLEVKGKKPPFFGFLKQINEVLRPQYDEYWLVFAGEWYENERVRLIEGTLDKLTNYLERPGNWFQRLYVVSTGRFQDSDEVPLIFKVKK